MKKTILLSALMAFSFSLLAQKDTTKQFILIVRYNPKMTKPTSEALQNNIRHWNEFMGGLGQNGQIVSGYRPSPDGKTINSKGTTEGAYYINNESISSFIIIKAASIEAAEAIAKKCPILEFNGSVEVRPLSMTN
jgi:hypothetical protein